MALGTQNGCVGAQSGIDYHERFASFVTTCPGGTFEIDPDALRYRAPGFGALEYVLGPRDRILQVPTERGAVAAGLQRITESVIVHIADELWNRINKNKQVPVDALCMAGGVALNCAANAAITMHTPWRRIWIQPAAHDAGTALGAALFVWHEVLAHAERVRFETAFWGPEYSDKECRAAALAAGLCYRSVRNLPGEAAKMAAQGRVIGWFQGRMEFGPRALGSRSILADPRRAGIRSILNAKIKDRETFRPFAPTVSAEHVSRFFSAPAGCNGGAVSALEYMLLAIPAKSAAVQLLPSVVHSNNTTGEASGRVHALFPGRNPRYEEFLAAFHEESGVPVVLNTSFNVHEPIVCTPDDACKTFLNSGMDALVLGSYLLEKDR
jgi:carbamoyltransferase